MRLTPRWIQTKVCSLSLVAASMVSMVRMKLVKTMGKHLSVASLRSSEMRRFGDSSASLMNSVKDSMSATTRIMTTQNGPGTAKNLNKWWKSKVKRPYGKASQRKRKKKRRKKLPSRVIHSPTTKTRSWNGFFGQRTYQARHGFWATQ